jgi:hypothetical protein
LKTVAFFIAVVTVDIADLNCDEQRRMIDQIISFSLLTPVLSPAGSSAL